MRPAERRHAIERQLEMIGRVSVADLARQLEVSPISVRRDLNDLVDSGIARRVHGGAVAARPRAATNPPVARRRPPRLQTDALIGLVVPSSRYYYTAILEGVRDAAGEARARVALSVSEYSAETEQAQIKRLVSHGVNGLIVTPGATVPVDTGTFEMVRDLDIPVVLMERDGLDEFAMLDSVRSDHALGARLAFQQLARDGHRLVALVSAEETASSGLLREGFEQSRVLFEAGGTSAFTVPSAPEYDPELVRRVDSAIDVMAEQGTTGVLVHSDIAAAVVAQRARDRDVGLTVIAYDNELAALIDPPLDAVAPPKREVGRLALQLAVERVRGADGDFTPRHIMVPPRLLLHGQVD